MKSKISIRGPIGRFKMRGPDGKEQSINGIQLVDVVAQVTALPETTKELVVEVGSLGGVVAVAKNIRAFLKSLQPRMQVTTVQVDDLASAGTIIMTAGSKRIGKKGINPETGKEYQWMVHPPWVPHTEGNASQLEGEAANLRAEEGEMISIYKEDIGISDEAIKPLMLEDSYFSTDQAFSLKFATEIEEAQTNVAYKTNNSMKTENKPDKTTELLNSLKKLLGVGEPPPAENPMIGKAVTIDGKAPEDGCYTVVKGVVTAIEPIKADAPPATPPAGAPPAAAAKPDDKADPAKIVAMFTDAMKAQEEKFTAEITALKKGVQSTHEPLSFTPENKAELVGLYDKMMKDSKLYAAIRNDAEKFKAVFFAKHGKLPNQ